MFVFMHCFTAENLIFCIFLTFLHLYMLCVLPTLQINLFNTLFLFLYIFSIDFLHIFDIS